MKNPLTKSRFRMCFAAGGILLLAALMSPALAFNATGGLTGWWEQPDEQNHGLIIAISRLPGGNQTGVVFWAHYDDEGNPTWLLAQGPLRGDTIEADLYQVQGIRFMQPRGTAAPAEEKVGTFAVTFEDCDQGQVDYNAPELIGSGNFDIQRLTTVPGMDCSGGVSDNVPPSARPERLEIDLEPALGFPDARGEVEWMMTPGFVELEVEIESVEPGEYSLFVGDEFRGTIIAVLDDDDDGGEGEIEFRSPERGNKPLLDFEPRGQLIEIFRSSDSTLVLSGEVPEEAAPVGDDKRPGAGAEEIEIDMINADVYPEGEAEAEWESYQDVETFEIEIEDIPVGNYLVFVDADEVGVIEVMEDDDGDTEGELEFRFPETAGFPVLEFDPRGALIDIVEGENLDEGTVIFFVEFPETDEHPDRPGPGGPGGKGPGMEIDLDLPKVTDDSDYVDASAKAELEIDDDGREFEVEIEDVPAGTYTLKVGGVERGQIEAVVDEDDDDEDGFNAEGEIKFSDPRDSDDELLDFDVRGELIEILEGDTVIFSGTFPNS